MNVKVSESHGLHDGIGTELVETMVVAMGTNGFHEKNAGRKIVAVP
jgi:hypothetical protein